MLPANAALAQLSQIVQSRTSTHEVTVKLNKIVTMLKLKQLKEAKEALEEVAKPDDLVKVKDERILGIYAYIYTL